jgi:hypothetical protein
MRPSEALQKNRDKVLEILSRYPVRNPRIFGSVARGEDTEGSDIDILVEFLPNLGGFQLMRLETEIEQLVGAPVEVHAFTEFGHQSRLRIERDMVQL